jgi:putative CocE/NonD family hydrolase
VTADVTGRYGELDVAVHQVAGWYDVFCESALRHFTGMAGSRRPQRLVIGPWSHSNGLSNLHPEHDFGGAANGGYAGVLGAAIDWNRRVLDGEDVDTGIACFLMGEDRWVNLDSWPPPAAEQLWFLGADGSLGREVPPAASAVLVHDPADPVPTRGGRVLGPWLPMAGPVDQRPIEGRPDVLVHTATVRESALRVLGPVGWAGIVTSTAGCFDVVVRLCDVHPDGRVVNVVEGVRRIEATPGTDVPVQVQVGSTAHVFRPGHRVRLHLAASSSPRLDVTQEPARHTVHLGGRTATALSLPVLGE